VFAVYREALEQGVHEPVGILRPDMEGLEDRRFTFKETGSYVYGSGLGEPGRGRAEE